MVERTLRRAIISLAVLAGCGGSAVCGGSVGPETLSVDASAFTEQPDVSAVEVCVVPENADREDALCSRPGETTVSYTTAESDYPSVYDYYVMLETGPSSFVFPEDGGGTHHMRCVATTTNIILPNQ